MAERDPDFYRFVLTPSERESPLWKRLRDHMERVRDDLRVRNDDHKLNGDQTAYVRGRISSFVTVIGYDKPPTPKATANGGSLASFDAWQPDKESNHGGKI